jgi:hypothetical protein
LVGIGTHTFDYADRYIPFGVIDDERLLPLQAIGCGFEEFRYIEEHMDRHGGQKYYANRVYQCHRLSP